MPKVIFTEEEIKQIVEDYNINNLSISEIARRKKRSQSLIRRVLKENNIEVKLGIRLMKLTQEQVEIIQSLSRQGKSQKEIAQKLGCDITVIKRIAKENNIKIKAIINPNIRKNFFENIDSEEKAYLLGLYFTDGNINKNNRTIRIQLQASDLEIIKRIKDIFQVNNKIDHDKRPNKECYGLSFNCEKMVQDLSKYGIIPRKTYETSHLPLEYIPEDLKIHFLRGLFDGDGGLSISADYSKDISFDLTSYHYSICEEYQREIDKLINKDLHNKISIIDSVDSSHRCRVGWRGKQQVLKILDILYQNATIYLKRKHDKYLLLKNYNNQ